MRPSYSSLRTSAAWSWTTWRSWQVGGEGPVCRDPRCLVRPRSREDGRIIEAEARAGISTPPGFSASPSGLKLLAHSLLLLPRAAQQPLRIPGLAQAPMLHGRASCMMRKTRGRRGEFELTVLAGSMASTTGPRRDRKEKLGVKRKELGLQECSMKESPESRQQTLLRRGDYSI